MKAQVTFLEYGIVVNSNGKTISLDPKSHNNCDLTFISHAHTDHLHKKNMKDSTVTKTLVSNATSVIAQARGYTIANVTEQYEGLRLVDNGHILGSKGLLIEDELYYTGDISIRERAFMKPAFIPSAHTLIIESTFGREEYVFPKLQEIINKTNRIISEMYDLGIPVILMGYPLGKAQLLTALFGHWDPLFVYDSIHNINRLHIKLGIPLKTGMKYSLAEKIGLLGKNKPWVMIAPLSCARSSFIKMLKITYGAITIGYSGWAVHGRYKHMMNLDYSMPMSDHCDYPELIEVVRTCNPEKIYTFHGFSVDFASSLRKMGFDAEALVFTNKSAYSKKRVSPTLDIYMRD